MMTNYYKSLICASMIFLLGLCPDSLYGRAEDIRDYIEKDIRELELLSTDSYQYKTELNRLLTLCNNNFNSLDTTTAKVYHLLSDYHLDKNHFQEALKYQKKELHVLEHGTDKKKTADAYTNMGKIYKWLSEYYLSEEAYLKGLELKRRIPDHTFFENYVGLCDAYSQQGKYNLLKQYANYALEVAKSPNQYCEAYYSLAKAHLYLDQYDKAKEISKSFENIATDKGLKYSLGKAYTIQGWIEIEEQDAIRKEGKKSDYSRAIEYYKRGIEMINASDYNYKERSLAYDYSTLSNIYRREGELEKSIDYGKLAVQVASDFYGRSYHQDMGSLYANLASKYASRFSIERRKREKEKKTFDDCMGCKQDLESSIRYQYEAIRCFLGKEKKESEIPSYTREDMYGINLKSRCITSITNVARASAQIYFYLGKDENALLEAERNISLAVDLIDIMRSEMSSKETKMLWRRSTKSRYDDGVTIAEWMGDINKMLYYMEKSKSILLLEELNHQEALSLIPESLANRETDLREKISDNKNRTPQDYNAYNSFLDSLQGAYPGYYEYKFDTKPPTISQVQENILDDSTAIVVYYSTSDSLYTINITKSDSELLTQSTEGISDYIETSLSYLNNKDSLEFQVNYDHFLDLSHTLYNRLFSPIKNKRRNTIVITDGMIEYLPFDILVKSITESGEPKYLIEDHIFSHASSIAVLEKKKKRKKSTFNNMLMVCPQRFESIGLAPLSYSNREIEFLEKVSDTEVLNDDEASLVNFKKKCDDFDVIHFSSHSGLDSETNQPWIAFQDSLISLNEIYKLNLGSSLVTLSSCKSFDGNHNAQEGINSLARAFLFADVSAVVGSLWNLNEASSLELFKSFYTNLKKTDTKSEALRQAKLKFIQENPYKSPYHWASLVMIGNPEGLEQSVRSPLYSIFWTIVSLVLVFLAFFWLRRKV